MRLVGQWLRFKAGDVIGGQCVRISFVLPCSGRYPIGGFRIIYEYANRLSERGHDVTLIHLTTARPQALSPARRLRARLQFVRDSLTGGYRPQTWFNLHKGVRTTCHFSLSPSAFVPGDAIIATAWQTAEGVAKADRVAGRKFYFIQGLESWNSTESELAATWCLPLEKLTIAKWLGDVAAQLNQGYKLIPNAIDVNFFSVRRAIEDRPPHSILFQCHHTPSKGTLDAVQALHILQERGLKFDATMFGLRRPKDLSIKFPHTFVLNPPQAMLRDLYNQHAIFVAPSWQEGWGLTPHEAGACGASLAVTDIGGHREFLSAGHSALMSSPRDPEALADNIQALLETPELRMRLAQQAARDLRAYDWDRSVNLFEAALAGPQDHASGTQTGLRSRGFHSEPRTA